MTYASSLFLKGDLSDFNLGKAQVGARPITTLAHIVIITGCPSDAQNHKRPIGLIWVRTSLLAAQDNLARLNGKDIFIRLRQTLGGELKT